MDANEKIRIAKGQKGFKTMPWSEVCMHMNIAGTKMAFQLTEGQYPGVQLFKNGEPFSFPIGLGEAGIHSDMEGYWYHPDR